MQWHLDVHPPSRPWGSNFLFAACIANLWILLVGCKRACRRPKVHPNFRLPIPGRQRLLQAWISGCPRRIGQTVAPELGKRYCLEAFDGRHRPHRVSDEDGSAIPAWAAGVEQGLCRLIKRQVEIGGMERINHSAFASLSLAEQRPCRRRAGTIRREMRNGGVVAPEKLAVRGGSFAVLGCCGQLHGQQRRRSWSSRTPPFLCGSRCGKRREKVSTRTSLPCV